MYFFEQINSILSGIIKNKLRVFLTMLGVIVGVCAVVVIISVGLTATSVVQMFFAGTLGDNRISAYVNSRNGKDFRVSYEELNELGSCAPMLNGPLFETETPLNGKAIIDDNNYNIAVLKGVSFNYFDAYQKTVAKGRFLSKADCAEMRSASVISDVTAKVCFGSVDSAIGKPLPFRAENGLLIDTVVVGVYNVTDVSGRLEKTEDKRTWSSDIYCTYEYINNIQGIDTKQLKYNEFSIIVKKGTNMEAVISFFDKILGNRSNDSDYIHICDRGYSKANEINGIVMALSLVFVAAAVLTLIVGGICLMNTMLVVVKERTKEIGTKKALGASNFSIIWQFLLESIIVCLIACILGVVLSEGIISIINLNISNILGFVKDAGLRSFLKTADIRFSINILAVVVSVVFSVLIGVIFGVYPSMKAAKMQITDALRYE